MAVMGDVDSYENKDVVKALEDDFLEGDNCWIFFRNKEIVVRQENWFLRDYNAFAIGKKGGFSQISTVNLNERDLNSYLKSMSDYFRRNSA